MEDHGLDADETERAYDLAAEAAMQRMLELERSMAVLPDLGCVLAEDLAALEAFRIQFRERHGPLLDRLAGYLIKRLDTGPLAVKEGHLRVCGWCQRIASRAHQWLPVGHLLPSRAGVPLTHTICPECVVAHGFSS